jgi:predicted ATPase
MEILKIKIGGYKNISETTIEFSGFDALVALNNYGKSNHFEAIQFANDFIQIPNKRKLDFMQFPDSVPINTKLAGKKFVFEVEYETVFNEIETIINYGFSFEWVKKNDKGKRIVKENLRIKKKGERKFTTFLKRNSSTKTYRRTEKGRCDENIKIDDNALIINKLENFDELYYLPVIKEINNFEFDFISLNNIERYFEKAFHVVVNDDKNELLKSHNIARFFYFLSQTDKPQYELLKNSIMDLLPDIEFFDPIEMNIRKNKKLPKDIPFELPENLYDIRVKIKSNNQDASINNLSEGSKRIFYILAMAILAEKNNVQILAYEELENSIHPALLQRLLFIISELTKSTQVIITSHSPHLVQYLDLNMLYIGIPNKDGFAYFKKVKKTKQRRLMSYAKDSESSLGDFIFDMLIEGFDEDSFWNDFI